MKKLSWVIALILAFTMALSLAACGSDGESDGQDDTPEENVEQETPEDGGNESETTDPSDVTEEPEQSTNWKKVVGAILVFGSFAGIAAVVIKKSM